MIYIYKTLLTKQIWTLCQKQDRHKSRWPTTLAATRVLFFGGKEGGGREASKIEPLWLRLFDVSLSVNHLLPVYNPPPPLPFGFIRGGREQIWNYFGPFEEVLFLKIQ